MIGKTVSHYEILDKLGAGGMGVVYKARDLKLDRLVALKFLPGYLGDEESDRVAHERFVQEAKAASALDHPHIANIHEIDETEEGQTFIVMSFYEGETLKKKIARGPLPIKETVDLARQMAEGLAKAHARGIVHRDIKPANVMITSDGLVKIIDFGLAKLGDATRITKRGAAVGTMAYMSPEQAKGDAIDSRTDIWSLGVVLYEMLTGGLPFKGDSDAAVLQGILNQSPRPVIDRREDIPDELERIVGRALQKDPYDRYASMDEVLKDLSDLQMHWSPQPDAFTEPKRLRGSFRRPAVVVPLVLVLLGLGFIGWKLFEAQKNVRWAREEALPEIYRHIDEGDNWAAFELARRAEPYLKDDPMFQEAWPEFSREVTIETSPSGADVYYKVYKNLDSDWQHLGTTPIDRVRIPVGFFRWKLVKEEFANVEAADSGSEGLLHFQLHREKSLPSGMVYVPGGAVFPYVANARLEFLNLNAFFLDRNEVTNAQFKQFVDGGGYQERRYWKQDFVKDDQIVSWKDAMALFRDKTDRPGPSTWELGTFPEGRESYPVGGVSWYEAVAYAEFAGKTLPTLYHWLRASNPGLAEFIVPLSNFGGEGPAKVGGYAGVGPYGSYDMAGNVEEWCWNEFENERYILGGSFENPSYMFSIATTRSAWDRPETVGFRCMKASSPQELPRETLRPIPLEARNYDEETPFSDEAFEIYRRLYSYDKTDLSSKVESREDSKYWTKEKITFNAAYGNERMAAYLFLPKDSEPPYQTIVYFPGANALSSRSSEELIGTKVLFVVKSGRALLYPIYKSTYERADGLNQLKKRPSGLEWRDHMIYWVKDLSRSIDYLETRADIDSDKLAYYGTSWGGDTGPICLALEDRLKVGILTGAGFYPFEAIRSVPEADQINFAPRVTVPVLMLNGRYDSLKPVTSAQLPMFRLLGTPDEHKRHILYDTGHFLPKNEQIRESLNWLDRYLGPVK